MPRATAAPRTRGLRPDRRKRDSSRAASARAERTSQIASAPHPRRLHIDQRPAGLADINRPPAFQADEESPMASSNPHQITLWCESPVCGVVLRYCDLRRRRQDLWRPAQRSQPSFGGADRDQTVGDSHLHLRPWSGTEHSRVWWRRLSVPSPGDWYIHWRRDQRAVDRPVRLRHDEPEAPRQEAVGLTSIIVTERLVGRRYGCVALRRDRAACCRSCGGL